MSSPPNPGLTRVDLGPYDGVEAKLQVYGSAASTVRSQHGTWMKRGKATGDYTNARLIESFAKQMALEFSLRDPHFNANAWLYAAGIDVDEEPG
jgi:hypothetical protein